MAPPLYFFPKTTLAEFAPDGRIRRECLRKLGLEETFADVRGAEDCSLQQMDAAGPHGHSGVFLLANPTDGRPPTRFGYYPDFQSWHQRDGFVVGLDREQPPAPEDLVRKKVIRGYALELSAGMFEIPVLRDPDGGTLLPRDLRYGDDGGVEQPVKESYRGLWDQFGEVVDWFFDPAGKATLSINAHTLDLCVKALAVNYRVGRVEQDLLGLVDSETWVPILFASIDLVTYRDAFERVCEAKKNRASTGPTDGEAPTDGSTAGGAGPPASTATSAGSGDCGPDTEPATASSGSPPPESEPRKA